MDQTSTMELNAQLLKAVKEGKFHLARYIINAGANVNFVYPQNKYKTVLHEAVASGNKKMVELLLEMGANYVVRSSDQKTPIDLCSLLKGEKKKAIQTAFNIYFESEIISKTYNKRPGTAAVGNLYETKLLTLILFRLLHDDQIENFYLGNNLDEAGAFDDVVLRTSAGGKTRIFCIQAKHRKAGTSVNFSDSIIERQTRGDFNLSKYFISYLKIRKLFKSGSDHAIFRGDYKKVELELIIFTPAKLVMNDEKVRYKVRPGNNIFKTNDSGKAMQIECTQHTLKSFKKCIKNMTGNISTDELDDIVWDFFSKFRFYSEQATEDELDSIAMRDIKLKNYESEDIIYSKSLNEIENWWKQSGQVSYQTKSCKIFEAALDKVRLDKIHSSSLNMIKKNLIRFRSEDLLKSDWIHLLEDIIQDKKSFINIFSSTPMLTCVKVVQYLQIQKNDFRFIDMKDPEIKESLFLISKEKPRYLVVIYVPEAYHDNVSKIRSLGKKLVVVTNRQYCGYWKSVPDETKSLLDLDTQSQDNILEIPVKFQGSTMPLRMVMKEASREIIDATTLQALIYEEKLEISCVSLSKDNEDPSDYYIERVRLNSHQNVDYQSFNEISDKTVVMAAEPGMGKSTLLTGFAKSLKKIDPSCWIVRINLLNYSKQLHQWTEKKIELDENAAMNFLTVAMSSGSRNQNIKIESFEEKIFRWYCDQCKIILLVDGFDEVSPYYTTIVLQLLKFYKYHFTSKLWVTTRTGGAQKLLEECLNVQAYALDPFTMDETKQFLKNFWSTTLYINEDQEKMLNDYVEELVFSWTQLFDQGTIELISVPLQIKMMAMIFEDDFLKYCQFSGYQMKTKKIYSVELYEKFAELKFNVVLMEEKYKTDILNPITCPHRSEIFQSILTKHKHAAFYCQFKETSVRKHLSKVEIKAVKEFLENVESSVEKTGIITRVIDGVPIFVHQTYAEYFVAKFIWEKLSAIEMETIACTDYFSRKRNIKKFINRLFIKFLIGSHQNQTAKFLQEIALGKKIDMPNINMKATILFERLLDIVAESYQELTFFYLLGMVESSIHLENEHFKVLEMLANGKSNNDRAKLLLNAAKAGYIGLVRLLANEDIIEMMGEGDRYEFKALYLAASGGHENVVEYLLSKSANVNGTSRCNLTPLHVASKNGYFKIVHLLLENGADVSLKDCGGHTALHLVAQKGSTSALTLLLENGPALDSDKAFVLKCKNVLNIASEDGHLEVVKLLLRYGADINCESYNEETPLSIATSRMLILSSN